MTDKMPYGSRAREWNHASGRRVGGGRYVARQAAQLIAKLWVCTYQHVFDPPLSVQISTPPAVLGPVNTCCQQHTTIRPNREPRKRTFVPATGLVYWPVSSRCHYLFPALQMGYCEAEPMGISTFPRAPVAEPCTAVVTATPRPLAPYYVLHMYRVCLLGCRNESDCPLNPLPMYHPRAGLAPLWLVLGDAGLST